MTSARRVRSDRRRAPARVRFLAAVGSLLAGIVVPVAVAVAVAAPAQAGVVPLTAPAPAQPLTFGVQPAGPTRPDSRVNFSYSVTPGAIANDHLAVDNFSNQQVALKVYASDAFNTADGGFDLLVDTAKSVDVGSWVTVKAGIVTVPARSKVIVPFRLSVPRNATPGDHAGGIVASLTSYRTDKKGNPIKVNQRVGSRVYLRVSGPLHPQIGIIGMTATYHGTANPAGCGNVDVHYQARNTGNTRLGGHQRLRVSGLFGAGSKTQSLPDVPELLPGNGITVNTRVSCVVPAIRVTATTTIDPVPPKGEVGPGAFSATAHSGLWALPWVLLAVLIVLLAGFGWWYVRRRRRRSPDQDRSAPTPKRAVAAAAAGAKAGEAKSGRES